MLRGTGCSPARQARQGAHFFRAFQAGETYGGSMAIWMMAVLLFALFGSLGYAKGAIGLIFPLAGLGLGVLLAEPLAPVVKPLFPLVGLKNPVWSILLPPAI